MIDATAPILSAEDLRALEELVAYDGHPARVVRAEVCERPTGARVATVHATVRGAPDRLVLALARPGDAWRVITTIRRYAELRQLADVLDDVLAARRARHG